MTPPPSILLPPPSLQSIMLSILDATEMADTPVLLDCVRLFHSTAGWISAIAKVWSAVYHDALFMDFCCQHAPPPLHPLAQRNAE